MVVCKCRKATRLYCFVHKVPVCGECICFSEHQICVVKQYSDWVINGDYDWPPICSLCHAVLEAGSDSQTTRLGCLHLIHTSCLVSHVQSFSSQTAPAGYTCPACSSPIWPPKNIKDSGSCLHSKLKEAIIQVRTNHLDGGGFLFKSYRAQKKKKTCRQILLDQEAEHVVRMPDLIGRDLEADLLECMNRNLLAACTI